MWDDETQLGTRLRAELASQPLPLRSDLALVRSRGRRRRRARQATAVIAVLAVVTGIGAGVAIMRQTLAKTPGGGFAASESASSLAIAPAAPAVTATTAAPAMPPSGGVQWPRVDLPPRAPDRTWSPGWTAPAPPDRPILNTPLCEPDSPPFPPNSPAPPAVRQQVYPALVAAAAPAIVGDLVERKIPANPDKGGDADSYDYSADITDAGGTGSVRLTVTASTGDPVQTADREAFNLSNCDPPRRTTLANGTILQLYPVIPSEPFQSLVQTLRIYPARGPRYQIEVCNFGSPDLTPNPAQPEFPNRTGAGRPTLPLTEHQLAAFGQMLAEAL